MENKKHLYKKVVLMAIRKGISLKQLKLAWILARQRQASKKSAQYNRTSLKRTISSDQEKTWEGAG